MRIKLDENLGERGRQMLTEAGHDAITVAEQGLTSAVDERGKRKHQSVVKDGKPTAVILDIAEYEQLLERLEEVEDLAALREMRAKPLQFRSLSEFLDEYNPCV